jgi:hypothetical protein
MGRTRLSHPQGPAELTRVCELNGRPRSGPIRTRQSAAHLRRPGVQANQLSLEDEANLRYTVTHILRDLGRSVEFGDHRSNPVSNI